MLGGFLIWNFWNRNTRGSHHSLTSEVSAADNHIVEHTKEYRNILQPRAVHSHGFGCVDILTLFTCAAAVLYRGIPRIVAHPISALVFFCIKGQELLRQDCMHEHPTQRSSGVLADKNRNTS